jgi:hypothetical protein
MQKPEDFPAGNASAGIHLCCTIPLARGKKPIAKSGGKLSGPVSACTIDHNDFCSGGSIAQLFEQGAYYLGLIQNRDYDRDPHLK